MVENQQRNAAAGRIIFKLRDAGLKPPKSVTLSITNRCNLRCSHCWLNSEPDNSIPLVPKAKILRLIGDFSALGTEKFVITGGEPLLHPDWYELLSFISEQPTTREVRLQTNATLVGSSEVEALLSLQNRGLIIQISLDGATPLNHDRVRGKGSFTRTMKGLQRLIDAGMAHLICISFTEMRHNFRDIPDLLRMINKMGCKQFITGTLVPGGRATEPCSLTQPAPTQYREILIRYQEDSDFREQYRRIGNISALEWLTSMEATLGNCCSFIEMPYVNADGTLYPCIMLHADDYAALKVYDVPLETAVSEKINSWSALSNTSRIRQSQLEECKECPDYSKCGGGCMGRAYTAHNNFLTAEDRCELRKVVYQQANRKN